VFDEKFLQNVRKREFHSFGDVSVIRYWSPETKKSFREINWERALSLLDDHPLEHRKFRGEKIGYILTHMELRDSCPDFAKDLIKQLASIFHKNPITCHMFGGFTHESRSFEIHKDKMDVLYLQVLGEVMFSTYNSHNQEAPENLNRQDAKRVYKQHFKPGRMYWVPRERYHLIEPLNSRVGFSFGVEGGTDPSTYV